MSDDTATTYAAAVHAAARAMYLAKRPGHPTAAQGWGSGRRPKQRWLLDAEAALEAALPLIREQIAREMIQAIRDQDWWGDDATPLTDYEAGDNDGKHRVIDLLTTRFISGGSA